MIKPTPNLKTTNRYEYNFDLKNKLIIEKFYGDISIDDIIEVIQNVFLDKRFSKEFNIIIDTCESKPLFHVPDLRQLISFLIKNKQNLHNTKVAFVTNKPRQVVDNYISDELAKGVGLDINFMPFSTYAAAYKWLNLK